MSVWVHVWGIEHVVWGIHRRRDGEAGVASSGESQNLGVLVLVLKFDGCGWAPRSPRRRNLQQTAQGYLGGLGLLLDNCQKHVFAAGQASASVKKVD
jgi:hypothetical protein